MAARKPRKSAPRAARPRVPARKGELTQLRAKLREAEDTLEAIRAGHVDALVIDGPAGEQVFTLRGADHRYRQLVETMTEGALLVDRDTTIVYGNARFAQLADVPLEHLLGSRLSAHVASDWHATLDALLSGRAEPRATAEVELMTARGARIPVYLSATASWDADGLTCVIATDLSAQKREQELVAAERLTSLIVEQSAESVVVCDLTGRVIRASVAAHRAAGENPLLQPFDAAFRIRDLAGTDASRAILDATRRGETISRRELVLETADILLSAAPIHSRDGEPLGAVISFVDITDRKQLAAERLALLEAAEAARRGAEAANRAKDEFLAMLGHELRNPLAPILTALDIMRAHPVPPPRVREIIERQVKHVVTLVDDLLDVSRITQGKIELDLHPLELAPIVGRAVELAGPLIEERGHLLVVDVPARGLPLMADETRIAQVLSNLLVNAAKYTERGGTINVRAAREGDEIVIRVRDNGMGIPPEILPHLFERFVQGRRTLERAEGGLGLGLAIVSSMVALHGGAVAVASEGVGQGSEFTVRLPAQEGAVAAERAPGDRDSGSREAIAAAAAAGVRRVLIVDDNVDAADLLAEVLGQLGHATRTAYDGPSALAIAAELHPEIAVLDIGLPGMSGFELAERLRGLGGVAPRLIALTGYGQDADRRRSIEAGFDAHLIKPVDLGVLVKTIARLAA